MLRTRRHVGAMMLGGVAFLLVMFGLIRNQYIQWNWRHTDFVELFKQRIRSELPAGATATFTTSGPDRIFVGNTTDDSRFICGPVLVQLTPHAEPDRHVYGLFVIRRAFGIRFNEGYTPRTSQGEEAQSVEFCTQARSISSQ